MSTIPLRKAPRRRPRRCSRERDQTHRHSRGTYWPADEWRRVMNEVPSDWEERVAVAWAALDHSEPQDFRAKIDALASERPDGDPIAAFERACSFDSTGFSDNAAPLYREALSSGLTGVRRRRATIQLASSLRNLGQAEESVTLLRAEQALLSDALDDAVAAVLALALADTGREREAVGVAVGALAKHLPRYNRSMANYARALREGPRAPN
jgi:tetratricopeptide (TPR) repeat protein